MTPDPRLSDNSDLNLVLRKLVQEQLDNIQPNDWDAYRRARVHWDRNRNIAWSDTTWERLGFPWTKPLTEDWFDAA